MPKRLSVLKTLVAAAAAAAAVAGAAATVACSSPKSDLDTLCAIASEVEVVEAASRLQTFATRADERVKSREARNILAALGAADPAHRLRLLRRGAAEVGYESFSCPPLERLLSAANE